MGRNTLRGFPKHKDFGSGLTTPKFTNKSGSKQAKGTVAIAYTDADQAFDTTTLERDRRVLGVLKEPIANNASGEVAIGYEITTVRVTGNVSRGDWLITSTTEGRAKSAGVHRPPGGFAIAQTEYDGGSNGEVEAMIIPVLHLASADGILYTFGGRDQDSTTLDAIYKMPLANMTFSTVTDTLTNARYDCGIIWNKDVATHGYVAQGRDAGYLTDLDKFTYSNETISAASAFSYNNRGSGMVADSDYGYCAGGYDGSGRAEVGKVAFATDTPSASTAIAAARYFAVGLTYESGNLGFITGGKSAGSTWEEEIYKITLSTGSTATSSSTLGTKRSGHFVGFKDTEGYCVGGQNTDGEMTDTEKIIFATEAVSISGDRLNRAAAYGAHGSFEAAALAFYVGGAQDSDPSLGDNDNLMHDLTTNTISKVVGGMMPIAISYTNGAGIAIT